MWGAGSRVLGFGGLMLSAWGCRGVVLLHVGYRGMKKTYWNHLRVLDLGCIG